MQFDGPNLYLVGFMATGKTTLGRLLAQRFGARFLDSDRVIEEAEALPVTEIFARHGEARFRELERQFILTGHPPRGCVVACGGGLVVQPGLLEELQTRGVLVCLQASPEAILQRVGENRSRPLLAGDDPLGRIRRLLAERAPIYARAGTNVLTDGRRMGEVVDHVLRIYRREAPEFDRRHGQAARPAP